MPRNRRTKKELPDLAKDTPVANATPSANDEHIPNDDKNKNLAHQQALQNKKSVASVISLLAFTGLAIATAGLWAPLFYFSILAATTSLFYLVFSSEKKASLDKKMDVNNVEQDVDALAKTIIKSDKTFTAKYNRIKAHFAKIETLETIEQRSPLISSSGEFNKSMVQRYVGTQLKAAIDATGQDKEVVKDSLMEDLTDLEAYADAKIKTLKAKRVIHSMRRS